MVRLIILLIASVCLASDEVRSRDYLERLYAFRALEQEIGYTFLDEKKELPSSLEEFEGMRAVAGIGTKQLNPYGIKAINSFVVVPGAPEIKNAPGIPDKLVGKRLYIISRFPTHDRSPADADQSDLLSGGRRAILISDHDSRLDIPWIPEPTAQLLIAQIKGFVPQEQTPAFVPQAVAAGLSVTELTTHLSDQDSTAGIAVDSVQAENNPRWLLFMLMAAVITFAIVFLKRSKTRSK